MRGNAPALTRTCEDKRLQDAMVHLAFMPLVSKESDSPCRYLNAVGLTASFNTESLSSIADRRAPPTIELNRDKSASLTFL
jgi:hypothetical protein